MHRRKKLDSWPWGRASRPVQELIRRGVIGPSFVVSFSHSNADIDRTAEAVHGALQVYRKAIDDGVEKYLEGRSVKPVYREFN